MTSAVLLTDLLGGAGRAGGDGPALELLDLQTLDAPASVINFTGVSTDWDYLVLRGKARSTYNGTAGEVALLLGGGAIDTDANYRYGHYHTTGGVVTSTGASLLPICRYTMPAATVTPEDTFGEFEAVILAATGKARSVHSFGQYDDVSGGLVGIWTDTATAIQRVRVLENTGGENFVAGSSFALYGTNALPFLHSQAEVE